VPSNAPPPSLRDRTVCANGHYYEASDRGCDVCERLVDDYGEDESKWPDEAFSAAWFVF